MSLEIRRKLILSTSNGRPNDRVIVKQGSIGTVIIEITINDRGGQLELPAGTTAKVRMLKPDKNQVLNDCTVTGNTVLVEITQQMQAYPGDGICEVVLLNGSQTLTTATFPVTIEANVHDDSQIESVPEYTALINSLVRVEAAEGIAESAYTTAQEAQTVLETTQTEEAARETAEQARQQAETTRAQFYDSYNAQLASITNQTDSLKSQLDTGIKAQNIQNNEISSLKLSDIDFTNLFTTVNATTGKYLDGTGSEAVLSGFAYTDYIAVEANTQYCGYFKSNDAQDILYYLCCYDSSKNYISTIGRNSSKIGVLSSYERTFITPSNCAYIRANYYTANISSVYISKNLRKNLKWLNVNNDNLSEPIKPLNVKSDFINIFTTANATIGKYLNGAGAEAVLSGFAYTDYIAVSPSTRYFGNFKSNDAQMIIYCLCCYDSAKNYIGTIQRTSIVAVEENYCGYFVTPSNCAYVRMNYHLTNLINVYLSLSIRKTLDWLNINQMINKNSKYNYSGYQNKTLSVIGDSITNGYGTSKSYRDYIKEKLLLRDIYNYGINGSSVSDGQNPMYARISSVQSADIIVFMGGTNDFAVFSNPLGELYTTVGNVKTPNTDCTTFYGALNYICKDLINRFTTSEIIICTPLHRETFDTQPNEYKPNSIGLYFSDYVNAIVNVSKFWGIKLCDLFNKSQLNPNIANCKSLYFQSSDGLHPNEAGHERIANEIIKTLLS